MQENNNDQQCIQEEIDLRELFIPMDNSNNLKYILKTEAVLEISIPCDINKI